MSYQSTKLTIGISYGISWVCNKVDYGIGIRLLGAIIDNMVMLAPVYRSMHNNFIIIIHLIDGN